jgi:protein-tyrosine-phosphatase
MAEAYARFAAHARGLSDLTFTSAGVAPSLAHTGMTSLAREALAAHGITIRWHKVQPLTVALIGKADLVVTLDASVDRDTRALAFASDVKVTALMAFAPALDDEVLDPWGGSPSDYALALTMIRAGVDGLLDQCQRRGNVASTP